MNAAEIEAAIARELARFAERSSTGTSLDFPEAFVFCRKDGEKGVAFTEASPRIVMMAMPDLDDEQVKEAVRDVAWKDDAFFVVVKREAWFVVDAELDEATRARVRAAARLQRLHELEPGIRREKLMIDVEGESFDFRRYEAEIVTAGESVTVAPWQRLEVTLPRPGFKRYLPETRDGARVRKLSLRGLS